MKQTLRVLIIADSCFVFAAGLFGPIYAIFVNNIGGDLLDAGWAWSAFMLAAGVLVYFLSRWEDKIAHYEQLIIGGYALQAIAIFSYLFISRPWHLMATQAALGFSEALLSPAFNALFTKSVEKGKEATQWGDWETMYYIVTAISAVIGAGIATLFGFRFLFTIMFGISIVGLLLSIRLVPGILGGLPKSASALLTRRKR